MALEKKNRAVVVLEWELSRLRDARWRILWGYEYAFLNEDQKTAMERGVNQEIADVEVALSNIRKAYKQGSGRA